MKNLLMTASILGLAMVSGAARADTSQLAAWQPDDGDRIVFDVFRNGKSFGTHEVSFSRDGAQLEARSKVSLKAGLGPITVYRYTLDTTERWLAGSLMSIDGEAEVDGDDRFVSASRRGDKIRIKGSAFEGIAPAQLKPSSHWFAPALQNPQMISTETGEIIDITTNAAGASTLQIDGQTIEAVRYDVSADVPYSVWYDDQGRWVKLSFKVRDQDITYELRDLY